jgi:uncharacterized protein
MITRRGIWIGGGVALLNMGAAYAAPSARANGLIAAARKQIGITQNYDPAYSKLSFPGGDVPRIKGVCTDVIVRAYRDAFGLDLQALVHTDMRSSFSSYPKNWGLRRPDSNIDHRRVPNLQTFFRRMNASLSLPPTGDRWLPGDIFTSLVGGTLPHIGIVSDRRSRAGEPLIIHNIGQGTREEAGLTAHKLTGRFRYALEG